MKLNKIFIAFALLLVCVLGYGVYSSNKGEDTNKTQNKEVKVGVLQLLSHPALDQIYKGLEDGLAKEGYKVGENLKIDLQNAQGDQSNLASMGQKLVTDNNDILVGITTPATLSLSNATKDKPIIMAGITYPVEAGLIKSEDKPGNNITGVSVHPGTAKGKMKNANMIAAELASLFPEKEVPEHTEGYEGFYLLHNMQARIEEAEMVYIIRDHDREKFLARKKFAEEVAAKINEKYGNVVEYELYDQYYNMGDVIKEDKRCVDVAEQAIKNVGVTPLIIPIRGGTDGSKISYMGIPTPNIFVGGENFHGQYEFSCLEHMKKAADTIVEIAKLAKK